MPICHLDTECHTAPSGHPTRYVSSQLWLVPALNPSKALQGPGNTISLELNAAVSAVVAGMLSSRQLNLVLFPQLKMFKMSGWNVSPFYQCICQKQLKFDTSHTSSLDGFSFFLNNTLHPDSNFLPELSQTSSYAIPIY